MDNVPLWMARKVDKPAMHIIRVPYMRTSTGEEQKFHNALFKDS